MQGQTVHGCGHTVFTDTVIDVATFITTVGGDRGLNAGLGVVRTGQVGRTADHFRDRFGQNFKNVLGRLTGGDLRLICCNLLFIVVKRFDPVFRKLAFNAALELVFQSGIKTFEATTPCIEVVRTACTSSGPCVTHVSRDLKRLRRPTEFFACTSKFFGTKWGAVRCRGATLGRSAKTDFGFTGDHRRGVGGFCFGDGGFDGGRVVTVNRLNIPTSCFKALGVVFRRRKRRRAINGNAVVVKQDDQFGQFHVASHRNGFLRNTFHQATVARDHIGKVIDNVITITGIHDALAKGETDRGRNALTQRAGGGFNAFAVAVFRMTGRARAHLTEILDLIKIEIFVSGQVQKRIQKHRTMTCGQDETVAVRPVRMLRIELQEFGVKNSRNICHAHWHARVTGFSFFDSIGRKEADGVGHAVVFCLRRHEMRFLGVSRSGDENT